MRARPLVGVLLCTLLLLQARAAPAAFTVEGFELVYTAPVETSLAREDLRSPAVVWPELLDRAATSIDIAQFYIASRPGEALEASLAALRRAGARGVKIRFLLEKRMLEASADGMKLLAQVPNLELRVIDWARLGGEGILHAKYIVVDRRLGYLGSQNFDWRSLTHVQELGLRLSDPQIVAGMRAIFDRDWEAQGALDAGRQPPPPSAVRQLPDLGRRAYLVASPYALNPPGVGDSESELVRLIGLAKEELRVQVLDYAPLAHGGRSYYPPIDTALRAAAARGVRVQLMVSNWNADHPAIDHLKSLSVLPGVSVRMVTIPEARQGFIPYARVVHAKYMVVDGKLLWLGTSNWTGGYLDRSRNLEVVVKEPALAQAVRGLHEQLWTSRYAEPLEVAKEYPRPRRR